MTHYSDKVNDVRVDFFSPSGKWKYTEALHWPNHLWKGEGNLIHDAFREVLRENLHNRHRGLTAVCLEPYHEYAHPIMMEVK